MNREWRNKEAVAMQTGGLLLTRHRIFTVCFSNANETTPMYELGHALGLPHTFDGISPNAKYTYEDGKTDNIMDYSSVKNSLFEWQWYVINTLLQQ